MARSERTSCRPARIAALTSSSQTKSSGGAVAVWSLASKGSDPGVTRARGGRQGLGSDPRTVRGSDPNDELIQRVSAIVADVVASVVMPSFRSLRPEDIQAKHTPGDPDDLVTIADKAAERYLIDALRELIPGAAFVGEEAVSEDPSLLGALSAPAPAWLIDPIDGTKNFARGVPDFGVMLALVDAGRTRASWMAVPAAQPTK